MFGALRLSQCASEVHDGARPVPVPSTIVKYVMTYRVDACAIGADGNDCWAEERRAVRGVKLPRRGGLWRRRHPRID